MDSDRNSKETSGRACTGSHVYWHRGLFLFTRFLVSWRLLFDLTWLCAQRTVAPLVVIITIDLVRPSKSPNGFHMHTCNRSYLFLVSFLPIPFRFDSYVILSFSLPFEGILGVAVMNHVSYLTAQLHKVVRAEGEGLFLL